MSLMNLKARLVKLTAHKELCKNRGKETENRLKELKNEQIDIESALKFLQFCATKTQQNIESKLSKIVTSALQTVYPEENYAFIIKFIEKRNSTECQLLFKKGGYEFNPLEEDAGGPIDIASLALLISFVILEKKERIIITDEPFKNVSTQKMPVAVQLLKNICQKLKFQIIMVSHFNEIIKYADTSFYIKKGEIKGGVE